MNEHYINPPGVQTVLQLARTQHVLKPRQEFEPHLGLTLTPHRAEIHLCWEQSGSFQDLHIATSIAAEVKSQLAVMRPEDSNGRLGDFKNKGRQSFSTSASQ